MAVSIQPRSGTLRSYCLCLLALPFRVCFEVIWRQVNVFDPLRHIYYVIFGMRVAHIGGEGVKELSFSLSYVDHYRLCKRCVSIERDRAPGLQFQAHRRYDLVIPNPHDLHRDPATSSTESTG
ncbi:hypothetical protein BKA70DRAFT_1275298, partial [Coprinopsis sp. MPI-PUGE-AT-0042]